MMADFHLLRPQWLLALLLLLPAIFYLWRKAPKLHAWNEVCDSHLLAHLQQSKGHSTRTSSLVLLFSSACFMILAGAGPAWYKLPVPTYKTVQPRVLVLDMSDNMHLSDLPPDRLSRAKFKLQDLFARKGLGQFGLVVFTGEPFVVSPLTEDGATISSLLSVLTEDIMPVKGQNLSSALVEASQLIKTAGYKHGQILVFTSDTPSVEAIQTAQKLAAEDIDSSIMPMRADQDLNPLYHRFAQAGDGQLLIYSADPGDLDPWLAKHSKEEALALSKDNDIPLWRDEGRWFLFPALLLVLPIFQRGWLQRVIV